VYTVNAGFGIAPFAYGTAKDFSLPCAVKYMPNSLTVSIYVCHYFLFAMLIQASACLGCHRLIPLIAQNLSKAFMPNSPILYFRPASLLWSINSLISLAKGLRASLPYDSCYSEVFFLSRIESTYYPTDEKKNKQAADLLSY